MELLLPHLMDFGSFFFFLICLQVFYFLISSLISSLIYWLFSSILFILPVFVFFFSFLFFSNFLFLAVHFNSHSIVVGKDDWYDFNFLKFIKVLCSCMWFILENVPHTLVKKCILFLLDGMFCIYLFSPSVQIVICNQCFLIDFLFGWSSIERSGVLVSPIIYVLLSIILCLLIFTLCFWVLLG